MYLLTSTGLQSRLGGRVQLDPEVCQLYRVDVSQDNDLLCLVPAGGGIPEIYPIIISDSLRDDYTREGITFRADGTGMLQAVNEGQVLISPDGSWELVKSGKSAPDGYIVEDELGFWLDDEHIAISGWVYPEGGGGADGFWVAINLDTREVVAERQRSGGYIVQRGSTIYDGGDAFTWDGTGFQSVENLSSAVQDPYSGLWNFEENSHSEQPATLSELGSGFTIELTKPELGHYADSNQSGTGSDIKYKQYYFKDNFVAYKYVDSARTPIQTINGEPVANNSVYDLGGEAGSLVLADSWSFWAYFKSGSETADVVIPYTVIDADGAEQEKIFTIPIEAIDAHTEEYPDIVIDPTLEDSMNQEPLAIRFATPEARQVTFCVADKVTAQVQCADLSDYDVRVIDTETDRGPRYFPSDMYACPDNSCNAYPGVLHVIMSGGRIFGYFKDSTDNQYYQGEALLSEFMTSGSDAMSFSEVQNGAGESEIIAAAASLNPDIFAEIEVDRLTTFDYDSETNQLTVDFELPLSLVTPLPELLINHDATGEALKVDSASRLDGSESTVLYALSSDALTRAGPATVTLRDGFFFIKNSAERYGWDTFRKIILAGEIGNSPAINLINGITPSFNGINTVTIQEEQLLAFTVDVSDADGDELTFSLSGPDASLLEVDCEGVVSFISAPDYELPSDSDANGTYEATLIVSDGDNETSITFEIIVSNGTDTVSGVLVDGYVAGSIIFQDVNGNGDLDGEEPSTTTDVLGNFTLELASFAPSARIRVVNSGFDIGSNETLGAMMDISPNSTGRLVMTPASTIAARTLAYQPLLQETEAENILANSQGLPLDTLPNSSLLGYDPVALLRNSSTATEPSARAVLAANQALMANGNVIGAAASDIVESALQVMESDLQNLVSANGGSGDRPLISAQ